MTEKALIISLRFNPGFIQTLIAYAKALAELGIRATFLVDPAYSKFPELANTAEILEFRRLPLAGSWTHAIFVNPALDNSGLAVELKRGGARILYVYHEPWHMSLSYVRNEGAVGSLRAFAAHRATVSVLRLADQILVPSNTALDLYRKSDARHNPRATYFPLIFDDEATLSLSELVSEKQYFSFIGKPCRSHAFDQFVCTMRRVFEVGMDVRFLIASQFAVSVSLLRDPVIRKHADQIEIRCGRPLGSEEMNRCYAESFCIWNLYRRSTQSGVLPKAFMFGTPVIASTVGSFPEFVEDRVNGRFVEAGDQDATIAAVKDIQQNIGTYAMNCRKSFHQMFYFRARLSELAGMLREE